MTNNGQPCIALIGSYMRTILTLLVPLVVASLPLVVFTGISRLRFIRASTPLLGLATLCSLLIGYLSSGLAVLLCANALSDGMHSSGANCVTGAIIFFPIGGFFSLMTLLLGLYMRRNQAFYK